MDKLDCIDSSVVLGTVFKEDERCDNFINTVGYKLKNKGLLTIPLVGEVFTNLFLKISKNVDDPFQRRVVIQTAIDFFDETIMNLLQQDRLVISKIKDGDYQHIRRIKELDYTITDDDALHLSSAINNNCQRFITLDKVLLNANFKNKMKKELGLVISGLN
jgi:predicted nucleic acid-binding protein